MENNSIGYDGKLFTVDSNGNKHEIQVYPTSIEWTIPQSNTFSTPQVQITGLVEGNGISVYRDDAITWGGKPDADEALERAMCEHEATQSDRSDDGSIYFAEDGSLYLSHSLPCNNRIQMCVTGVKNANESCDKALKFLERMKERIDEIQKKVFELSLNQKIEEK